MQSWFSGSVPRGRRRSRSAGLQQCRPVTLPLSSLSSPPLPSLVPLIAVEEGHEGLTQFLMNEVVKLQQQSNVKTLQTAELSRKNCTLEDEQKKLRVANQELQAIQQSKDTPCCFGHVAIMSC